MHRLGGLLDRLRRESASTPSQPLITCNDQLKPTETLTLDISTSSSESVSLIEGQESSNSINLKQQRHKARRERQRQRKLLGQTNHELSISSSDIGEASLQVGLHDAKNTTSKPLEALKATTWFKVTEDNSMKDNFLKGVKWSPTGDRIVTNSEDGRLRLYHCPGARQLDGTSLELCDPDSKVVCLSECIYDMAWYPYANMDIEGSSLVALSARARPIQLWDVTSGTLRASYRSYDHLEAVCTPHALTFSSDTTKLIGGFENMIRVFPVDCPGSMCYEYPTHAKGFNLEHSLPGIISSVAINPDYSRVFAAGSFRGRIMLYHEESCNPIFSLEHPGGSISQVKFSPCGNYLFSASRNESSIHCFDIRKTCSILWTVARVSTNYQRVGFDIDPYGRMLGSASQDGRVRLWDITQGSPIELSTSLPTCPDAINTFQFHPFMPYWCIATGQRHYGTIEDGEETSDDDSSDDATSSTSSPRITPINQIIVGSFENMTFESNLI